MRIAIHSDLHLEGHGIPRGFLEDKNFDVVLLAGDICSAKRPTALVDIKARTKKPILLIEGNHEFYKSSVECGNRVIDETCSVLGILYASRRVIKIDGVAFICATGWSDLESFPQYSREQKEEGCSRIWDFRVISDHPVDEMIRLARADYRFIETSLMMLRDEGFKGKVVVMTHFSPAESHGNVKFETSPLSSYFSNDWVGLMYEYKPDLWVFGHTHCNTKSGCKIGETMLVCNQRGYGRECEGSYNPNFVIEI